MIEYEVLLHDTAPSVAEWTTANLTAALRRHPPRVLHTAAGATSIPALAKMIAGVETDYVLTSSTDSLVIRRLPVEAALIVMDRYGLHHVAFDHWRYHYNAKWERRGITFGDVALVLENHYFLPTPALWRVSQLRPVVEWCVRNDRAGNINHVYNGGVPDFPAADLGVDVLSDSSLWDDHDARKSTLRTYSYGHIHDEERYYCTQVDEYGVLSRVAQPRSAKRRMVR